MQKLRAFLSLLSALILLVSSIGFSVSRHYCLGMLAEESFYHLGNESCGMTADACDPAGDHLSNHCCDDENLAIPGVQVQQRVDDTEQITAANHPADLDLPQTYEVVVITDTNIAVHNANAPPGHTHPTGRDILIHFERFLI